MEPTCLALEEWAEAFTESGQGAWMEAWTAVPGAYIQAPRAKEEWEWVVWGARALRGWAVGGV